MTMPAVPEALEDEVYSLVLRGKTYRWVSDWLQQKHKVTASRSAVQSCLARVRAEKVASLLDVTAGNGSVEGGVEVLDSIYRESRVLALRASETGDLAVGLRGLEQQFRIVRFHCQQLREAARAQKEAGAPTPTAPRQEPDNTLTAPPEVPAIQGVATVCQGAANTPTTHPDGEPPRAPSVPPPFPAPMTIERLLEMGRVQLAKRHVQAALNPDVLEHRERWAGDHYRPPK